MQKKLYKNITVYFHQTLKIFKKKPCHLIYCMLISLTFDYFFSNCPIVSLQGLWDSNSMHACGVLHFAWNAHFFLHVCFSSALLHWIKSNMPVGTRTSIFPARTGSKPVGHFSCQKVHVQLNSQCTLGCACYRARGVNLWANSSEAVNFTRSY